MREKAKATLDQAVDEAEETLVKTKGHVTELVAQAERKAEQKLKSASEQATKLVAEAEAEDNRLRTEGRRRHREGPQGLRQDDRGNPPGHLR
ncbi:hypothetical protein ACU686_39925 [Yinghuangia aomiensis]